MWAWWRCFEEVGGTAQCQVCCRLYVVRVRVGIACSVMCEDIDKESSTVDGDKETETGQERMDESGMQNRTRRLRKPSQVISSQAKGPARER